MPGDHNALQNDFCKDKFWDSNLTWHTANPDFTQCFQQSILIFVPCFVFSLAAVVNLKINWKRGLQIPTPCSFQFTSKLVLCIITLCLSVTELTFAGYKKYMSLSIPDIDIYANSIKVITYVTVLMVTVKQRDAGNRSSSLLTLFWFLTSIFALVMFRSVLLQTSFKESTPIEKYEYLTKMVYFPILILQFLLSLFPNKLPASLLESKSPCEEAPFFSFLTFHWFHTIISKGRKKLLTFEDLPPPLIKLDANYLWNIFEARWAKELNRHKLDTISCDNNEGSDNQRLPWLAWTLIRSFWPWISFAFMLQILDTTGVLMLPLLLDQLLTLISGDDYLWKGYLFSVALLLADFAARVSYNFFAFYSESFGLQLQSTISSAIYRKAMKLSCLSRRKYPTGKIVNLVSVDVEKIYNFCTYCTLTLGAPLKIVSTVALLWVYLGPSCLAGVGILLSTVFFSAYASNKINNLQAKQMEIKDVRLKLVTEILNGIKVLKLYAWEIPFIKKISEIRVKEVGFIRSYQMLFAALSFVWGSAPFLFAVSSFVTYIYVNASHTLTPNTVFVSLNLLNIIRYAVLEIPELAADLVQVIVSIKRVATFLSTEELEENAVGISPLSGNVISIRNAVFSWDHDKEPNLEDINLHVKRGALVAVVGPVGSGKSTLLSAMLGETYKPTGTVDIEGQIAYVPQQAWILNQTLKQNVLFMKPMHRSVYENILDNCCLRPDLDTLPAGDETEIGEKGVNLSGGQKQRISVARAVYHNADIYLLDDPLSAVDAHVGKHIFEHVIGKNGILRNKTRVLITHNISVLPEVDVIISMKNGRIVEMGTYNELMQNNDLFAELVQEYSTVKVSEEENKEGAGDASAHLSLVRRSISTHSRDRTSSVDSKTPVEAGGQLTEDEAMEVGEVKMATFIRYVKLMSSKICLAMMLGYLSYVAFETGGNIWLSKWSNDPGPVNGTSNIPLRDLRIAVYTLLGFAQGTSVVLAAVCLAIGTTRASKRIHLEMLESVMKAPMLFFDTTPLGRIINRFGRDMDEIDTGIGSYIDGLAVGLFSTVGTIAVIGFSAPIILSVILPLAILYYIIQRYYLITSRQLKRLSATTRSPVYSHYTESIQGTSSINAYDVQEPFIKKLEDKVNANCLCQFLWNSCCRWLDFRLEVIGLVILFLTSLFAVIMRGKVEVAVAGLMVTYALSVTDILTWLVRNGTDLENRAVSVERVSEYSLLDSEAPWRIEDTSPPSSWPHFGRIEFKNYSTKYRENLDLVLRDISLMINEKEKVGIVGRTGAGKSSFTLALFRMIEPVTGTISIDDINISRLGLHQLRSKLTIIPQDPVLFTGVLRSNLDPNDDYSDEDVWKSLEHSHLKEFVSALPDGLAHEVAEGGSNLSVGQRQLICLARALLKKTKILVLDEATAAVDVETDSLIQSTIRSEFKDHTVITIAHRLNTIMDYDKILVMDSGTIVEMGKPCDLLKDTDSRFHNMAKDAGLL